MTHLDPSKRLKICWETNLDAKADGHERIQSSQPTSAEYEKAMTATAFARVYECKRILNEQIAQQKVDAS